MSVNFGATAGDGSLRVTMTDGFTDPSQVTWTSATTINTAYSVTTTGMDTVILTIAPPAGLTAGVVSFQAWDGYNWVSIKAPRTDSYFTDAAFVLSGNPGIHSWQIPVAGYPKFQAILTTAIVGAGSTTVTCLTSSAPDTSIITVGFDPLQGKTSTRLVSAATTNSTLVKSTAGVLFGFVAVNTSASIRYLKFYNLATAPVVGTSTPVLTLQLPVSSETNLFFGDIGMAFSNGVGFGITGAVADTDTTAIAAGDVYLTTLYA